MFIGPYLYVLFSLDTKSKLLHNPKIPPVFLALSLRTFLYPYKSTAINYRLVDPSTCFCLRLAPNPEISSSVVTKISFLLRMTPGGLFWRSGLLYFCKLLSFPASHNICLSCKFSFISPSLPCNGFGRKNCRLGIVPREKKIPSLCSFNSTTASNSLLGEVQYFLVYFLFQPFCSF